MVAFLEINNPQFLIDKHYNQRCFMKAMILAAGLGVRLRPLTLKKPKVLVPVANRANIDMLIAYLKSHGVQDIIVNTYYLYEQIVDYLNDNSKFGINVNTIVESQILGTGGGIKNTEDFWGKDPFIVINGDIITNINLTDAINKHIEKTSLVTLILHDYKIFNQIKIDSNLNILDISSKTSFGCLAFTGIHIIDPFCLNFIPDNQFSNIINCYRKIINLGYTIKAYTSKGHYWRDLGTPKDYMLANKEALKNKPFLLAPDSKVSSSVELKDWVVIGNKTEIGDRVIISGSVLWEGVKVKNGIKIIDSVVTSNNYVTSDLIGKII